MQFELDVIRHQVWQRTDHAGAPDERTVEARTVDLRPCVNDKGFLQQLPLIPNQYGAFQLSNLGPEEWAKYPIGSKVLITIEPTQGAATAA